MQNHSCLNLQAQSGVAASVAIAVAALPSAVRQSPPPGYGRVAANHLDYLKKTGFPDDYLDQADIYSASEGDGFALRITQGLFEFVKNDRDGYVCSNPCGLLAPSLKIPPRKDFGDTLFVTQNPLSAILGAHLGIPSVAVAEEDWLDPGVTLPLPDDVIYCTQAAKPDSRLLALADGREVILDASFGLSPQLGHSLKYHSDCQVFVWQPAPEDALTPALLIAADEQSLQLAKAPLRRRFVSYPYEDNAGETLSYHYPLVYRASDDFIPCIEKDEMKSVTGKDGKEAWVKKRVPMKGFPNCRIRRTMIVTQTDAGIISLDRNAGSSTVIEEMEGVTSTRREVTFHQQPSDYTADAYIAKDFTNTQANKLPEFRGFLAAQKGQRGHPIAFGTHSKGYFGLRQPGGETVYSPPGTLRKIVCWLCPVFPPAPRRPSSRSVPGPAR